ncbi:IclR family transcriptional regulator C-terminal domain-containing protein [Streptomyces sp. NPDC001507]|uniref:IclR family transcriptional regulator domain-containing protein n=1 Tax=Streptomyces sp. NPDC001507 TaxID=3364579 RepID=UPI00368453E7
MGATSHDGAALAGRHIAAFPAERPARNEARRCSPNCPPKRYGCATRGVSAASPTTPSPTSALLADLAVCQARRYALNFDEGVTEVHPIGMPVRDSAGLCVAAITVSAPGTRLGHAGIEGLLPPLRKARPASPPT